MIEDNVIFRTIICLATFTRNFMKYLVDRLQRPNPTKYAYRRTFNKTHWYNCLFEVKLYVVHCAVISVSVTQSCARVFVILVLIALAFISENLWRKGPKTTLKMANDITSSLAGSGDTENDWHRSSQIAIVSHFLVPGKHTTKSV